MCQDCYNPPSLRDGVLKSESVLAEIETKIIELAHIIQASEIESGHCMLGPRTRGQYLTALCIMLQARQHMKIMRETDFDWAMTQFRANMEVGREGVVQAFGWDEDYVASMQDDEASGMKMPEEVIDVLREIFGTDAVIIPFEKPEE